MSRSTHLLPSGYLLPSIHAAEPFFAQQPNPQTQAVALDHWTRLILGYARHRKLFFLRVEDVDAPEGEWTEVLRNDRIKRKVKGGYLEHILAHLVTKGVAAYEPPKQTRSVLLYWRLPEEWAEVLHEWAVNTGQMNTILTFYEIMEPPIESPLSGIPPTLLKTAIGILAKTGRAQTIAIPDGEGVRFFSQRK
ncbi:ESCRT-II complex vps25 subunit [Peniophora sp. CONT]|nr:ESCRT-II complex vps25 subunit [Peniophora sp. CONT]